MSRGKLVSSIYYQEILKEHLLQKKKNNKSYSLRAFARDLNLNNGVLSQFFSLKRIPSLKQGILIANSLNLNDREQKEFIQSIVKIKQEKDFKKNNFLIERISKIKTSAISYFLNESKFDVISDWFYYAILELTFVKDFKSDYHWIANRLGLTAIQTKKAIQTLLDIGLLFYDKNHQLKKSEERIVTSNRDKTAKCLKKRQEQILQKSIKSLYHDPIEIRNHSAMTIAINPQHIQKAKIKIDQFLLEMTDYLEVGEQSEVYELSVSLFPLTKCDQK